MWIRTQDRMALVPCGTLGYPELRPEADDDGLWRIDMCMINPLSRTLGAYRTEKRCLEVLDEVQKAIRNGITDYEMPKEEK